MINKNQYNKFALLWIGQFISSLGSGLTSFGLMAYVYLKTGKTTDVALITLIAFLPGLLFTPISGVFADRYDRRKLMILGDSLSALGLLYILFSFMDGRFAIWKICVGVGVSSIFISLIEPSYKATVTDLLNEDQYTKASGLIQIAGASKFILAPIIAGYILSISGIKIIIIIDICTFFITVLITTIVRKDLVIKEEQNNRKSNRIIEDFKAGWIAISSKRGVLILVIMTSLVTFFVGFIQVLLGPMILSFKDSNLLGLSQTISALGMLCTGIFLSVVPIKKNHVKILTISLLFLGVAMIWIGVKANIIWITVGSFLFFMTLPFINACIDYLIRTNIEVSIQGTSWGLIGIISQIGYIIAYSVSGYLADFIFEPLMKIDGVLSKYLGLILGIGKGRGIALLIILAGILLAYVAIIISKQKDIRLLEERLEAELCVSE